MINSQLQIETPLYKSDNLISPKINTPSFQTQISSKSNEIFIKGKTSSTNLLFQSIISGNVEQTKTLLEKGADPNFKSKVHPLI